MFPSPSGIMSSSMRFLRWLRVHRQQRFRPLRGSCLPQWCWKNCARQRTTPKFPSPSGIMSSSMVLEKLRKAKDNTEVSVPFGDHVFLNKSLSKPKVISALLFPSPSGIMSSSIQGSRGGTACCIPVSVPFGDHVFLNVVKSLLDDWKFIQVSVPFGDHVFLNGRKHSVERYSPRLFPSPSGIMSSSMMPALCRAEDSVFPSPSGIMSSSMQHAVSSAPHKLVSVPFGDHVFLNYFPFSSCNTLYGVSVPFGDHVFLNNTGRMSDRRTPSFRPLRGSCLPQFLPFLFVNHAAMMFPSPSGIMSSSI